MKSKSETRRSEHPEPATPLPWKTDIDRFEPDAVATLEACVEDEKIDMLFTADTGTTNYVDAKASAAFQDAHYIVTACNAFPKLVEALRALVDNISIADEWPGAGWFKGGDVTSQVLAAREALELAKGKP